MNFSKDFKNFHVNFLSELPMKGIKVDVGTMVGVPSENKNQINLYTWYNDEWIFTAVINKSDTELGDLKDACDDLSNAVKKLIKVSANTESDELFSKLTKITTKILQAKYELVDDVLEQFERS